MSRRFLLPAVLWVICLCFGADAAPAARWNVPLPTNVNLEQWRTLPSGAWTTGALQSNNSDYGEGETVPFRLAVSALDNGSYDFEVCRQFENSGSYGYLVLAPYNTSRAADPGGTITSTSGSLSGVNVTVTVVLEDPRVRTCPEGAYVKTRVTIELNKANSSDPAYVLWGARLAKPGDAIPGTDPVEYVPAGKGASSFPGGSLSMTIVPANKNVGIQTNSIAPTAADLLAFRAARREAHVKIHWRTALELNLYGFNVWRRTNKGTFHRLNQTMIPAAWAGQVRGDGYAFRDETIRAGNRYRYKLEVLMANGQSEWSNVVTVWAR